MDDINSQRSVEQQSSGRKSSSSRRSRRSEPKSKPAPVLPDVDSEDISMSQLEMLANKKKLAKRPDETQLFQADVPIPLPEPIPSPPRVHSASIARSTRSSSSDSSVADRKQRYAKQVKRENENDMIRKEKSELLCKFNKVNFKGRWSSLQLDMNCTLDEIRNEVQRVRSEIENERSVAFFKRMLLLGVQGIEMLNTKFDPLGVDLDGWSEAMGYSLENQEYDEVLSELYEKYKGAGTMSPEMKLVFMIISSATMFTISKKITKMDTSNSFANFIGNTLFNKSQAPAPQPMPTPIPQPASTFPTHHQQQQEVYHAPSDTSDDPAPSKLRGPGNNDIADILRTMNERKREKELMQQMQSETADDVLKSIPISNVKRKRGRPPKAVKLN